MESYTKRRPWNAWQGDLDQLKRLASVIRELHTQRLAEAVKKGLDKIDDKWLPRLDMSIRERIDHYGGPLDVMIEQFDRRTALGIQFSSRVGDDRIVLDLGGGRILAEVELSVSSSDPAHTRLAFARISDEVDRGVPWWAKIHSGILVGAVTAFASVCISTSALLIVGHFKHLKASEIWQTALGAFLLVLLCGAMGSLSGVGPRWLFPKFEVTGDGVSSASRRLWSLIGILLTVPVGIVINRLS